MRSSGLRAAGSRGPTPTSCTSTRSTRAATSPHGRSPTFSRRRCEPHSSHCGDRRHEPTAGSRAVSLFGTRRGTEAASFPSEGRLPGFDGATGWLNSAPLTPAELRGKAVLVDFWTYTCINWLRTLGYVRAWAKKYESHGLVTIGVHTPEFAFERDVDNVREAVAEMNVCYPVALDPNYAGWPGRGSRCPLARARRQPGDGAAAQGRRRAVPRPRRRRAAR